MLLNIFPTRKSTDTDYLSSILRKFNTPAWDHSCLAVMGCIDNSVQKASFRAKTERPGHQVPLGQISIVNHFNWGLAS